MTKNRLEAFSDGVLAIAITIMVLELKAPHGAGLAALAGLAPVFLSYVLSFIYVGIYWNNHHHMLHAAHHVSGAALWANLHLLFWLSLFPFTTAWLGEHPFEAVPCAVYGGVLFMAAVAYGLLQRALITADGQEGPLARAVGHDRKGRLSMALYALGVGLAFVHPGLSLACYVVVALIWLVPDRRIERALEG
ncbi:MAG: DUF1211 domain-containing protein [Proteobacteria bacterium]|uniref:TMEM175 family protein n=1 Tax=Aquabacterium sp. TaxID=1872578 RepID=UPI0035C7615D|nr:DUF1211 domain-containing protein [Pseudomonadota bacterium]